MTVIDDMEAKIDEINPGFTSNVNTGTVLAGKAIAYGLIAIAKVLEPMAALAVEAINEERNP